MTDAAVSGERSDPVTSEAVSDSGHSEAGAETPAETLAPDVTSAGPDATALVAGEAASVVAVPLAPELAAPATGEAALPEPAPFVPPASPSAPTPAPADAAPAADTPAEIAAVPEVVPPPAQVGTPEESGAVTAPPSGAGDALTDSPAAAEASGPTDRAESAEPAASGTAPAAVQPDSDADADAETSAPEAAEADETAPSTALPGSDDAAEVGVPEPDVAAAAPSADSGAPAVPSAENAPEQDPVTEAAVARPRILQPAPALGDVAEGVTRNRLPSIGSEPAELIDETLPTGDALRRNARSFANPSGRPPFAVLLLDEGGIVTEDLAEIAASKLPLTLVVNPAAPEAAARAALWRAAGQEVALLAEGIAAGAKGSDGEIAVEAMVSAVPEALALVAPPGESALQSDRMAATAVVPALAARGFGLVTWDQGLNAADQVARREGLAAVTIYRDLTGRDDNGPVITRALDRAAFKAQQDGRAVVFGRLEPATIEALMSWSLSARAASLTPAPLSAVLK